MKELLFGETMIKASVDILITVLVFIFIYILCVINHLKKNILRNALSDMQKMKKTSSALKSVVSRKKSDRNAIRKALWRIRLLCKNTNSILRVHLYEKGEDAGIRKAVGLLEEIQSLTDDFAKAYNTKAKDELVPVMETLLDRQEKTIAILTDEVKEAEEYSLTKI